MMNTLALKVATEAHKGQTRWNGIAYITHPIGVAEMVKADEEKQVALLHDVLEDTEVTGSQLYMHGFSTNVLAAVTAITHLKEDSYQQYLEKVKKDKIATTVKIADINYNLADLEKNYPHKTKNIAKYKQALEFLK
jgi:(p)ppGpp synthase/HD superfamily hydrolase